MFDLTSTLAIFGKALNFIKGKSILMFRELKLNNTVMLYVFNLPDGSE